jgi:hypothetical protein
MWVVLVDSPGHLVIEGLDCQEAGREALQLTLDPLQPAGMVLQHRQHMVELTRPLTAAGIKDSLAPSAPTRRTGHCAASEMRVSASIVSVSSYTPAPTIQLVPGIGARKLTLRDGSVAPGLGNG